MAGSRKRTWDLAQEMESYYPEAAAWDREGARRELLHQLDRLCNRFAAAIRAEIDVLSSEALVDAMSACFGEWDMDNAFASPADLRSLMESAASMAELGPVHVPDAMIEDRSAAGTYGENVRGLFLAQVSLIWDKQIRDRFIELANAYDARFGKNAPERQTIDAQYRDTVQTQLMARPMNQELAQIASIARPQTPEMDGTPAASSAAGPRIQRTGSSGSVLGDRSGAPAERKSASSLLTRPAAPQPAPAPPTTQMNPNDPRLRGAAANISVQTAALGAASAAGGGPQTPTGATPTQGRPGRTFENVEDLMVPSGGTAGFLNQTRAPQPRPR
ncbi:hypothetical protein DFJ74DRAFT_714688 [Hyaloraphidium curvatum]|nr:hypothetical protein DFJ74DRAFT_714688 [Hyaloraphidium curvatum]